MNTALSAISPSDLAKLLEKGEPASQLVDVREYLILANPTKRTIAQEYDRVSKSIRLVFVTSYRKIHNPEARKIYEAKAALYREELRNQMNNISNDLLRLTEKWESELAELEIEPSDNFSNPVKLRVEITSPEQHHFWEIILQMDRLLVVMENLWHYRKLKMEEKQDVIKVITRGIYGFSTNLSRRAGILHRMQSRIYSEENKAQLEYEDNSPVDDAEEYDYANSEQADTAESEESPA